MCLPAVVAAAEPVPSAAPDTHVSTADIMQRRLSQNLNHAAQWVDSFFDDERYSAEDASSKLRLGQAVFLEYGDTPKLKTRVNLSLDVPRTEQKLKLFIGGDDDANRSLSTIPDSVEERDNDGSSAGIQFFAKASERRNLSLSAGVKISSAELFAGPRYRHTFSYRDAQLRFTQGVRWYTSRGWESRTRLDYERLFGDDLFFRQSFDGRWREEDPGYRYELRSSVIQPLPHRKAIEYQWANLFTTHPHQRLESTVLRIRYRQSFLRKWLFYEMNPQLAMRNDESFKPKPGILLRLEVVLGGKQYSGHGNRAARTFDHPPRRGHGAALGAVDGTDSA